MAAPRAMATGIKACPPDGGLHLPGRRDLPRFGMAEILPCCSARWEKSLSSLSTMPIWHDNGGQNGATPCPAKNHFFPYGRDVEQMGFPIRAAELLATLDGAGYVVRRSLHDPKNIRLAKKAIRWLSRPRCAGWLFIGRAAFHLPHQLGHETGGSAGLAGRAHDSVLSRWRFQGLSGAERPSVLNDRNQPRRREGHQGNNLLNSSDYFPSKR